MTTTMTPVRIGRRPDPITLTDAAVAKVADLLAQEGDEQLVLRVAVRPGGCSGYSYEMFFDSEVAEDDIVRTQGSVRVAVDLDPGLHRRAAGGGLPHLEPQRHPHLRLRLLLQLSPPRVPGRLLSWSTSRPAR
ncbi:iron-sulfur cluster assembly accessory protein [Aciditerrimonas ferrireducens]|nr:iron-sulfur cluster assembly accessory protein [Aciditerrimonas ferrireducens]MCK4176805.1 iron-sulfur cluster assembly accessory protein [Aciditerrimonas ferrireducens]